MKFFWYFLFLGMFIFLVVQLVRLVLQERFLSKRLAELTVKTEPLREDTTQTARRLEALQHSAALERELRRAGYAAPGEKVFIIIPSR